MNREQFKGQWKQLKGELNTQWGQLTDDDVMAIEGDYDKFLGSVQARYGAQNEEVRRWVDQWLDRHQSAKPGARPKAG